MTFVDIIRTFFEILMVAALFWCIFNEDKLIAFEKGLKAYFKRRRLRVVKPVNHNIALYR